MAAYKEGLTPCLVWPLDQGYLLLRLYVFILCWIIPLGAPAA